MKHNIALLHETMQQYYKISLCREKEVNETKTYRIKGDLVKQIKKKTMEYVIDRKELAGEAEIVNALILKGLETIRNEDIDRYLRLAENKQIR